MRHHELVREGPRPLDGRRVAQVSGPWCADVGAGLQSAFGAVARGAAGTAERAEPTVRGALPCPTCGQIDLVQRVTAVLGEGISDSRLSGPSVGLGKVLGKGGRFVLSGQYTWLRGEVCTRLAGHLAAAMPKSHWMWGIGLAIFGVLCLVNLFPPTSSSGASWMEWLILGLGPLGFGVSLIEQSRRADRAARNLVHLYYCHRCDGVFVPGRSGLVPVGAVGDLLNLL